MVGHQGCVWKPRRWGTRQGHGYQRCLFAVHIPFSYPFLFYRASLSPRSGHLEAHVTSSNAFGITIEGLVSPLLLTVRDRCKNTTCKIGEKEYTRENRPDLSPGEIAPSTITNKFAESTRKNLDEGKCIVQLLVLSRVEVVVPSNAKSNRLVGVHFLSQLLGN